MLQKYDMTHLPQIVNVQEKKLALKKKESKNTLLLQLTTMYQCAPCAET